MARDGIPYVLIPALAGVVCFLIDFPVPAVLLLGLAGFMGFFFRDPERMIPEDDRAIVSPADGKVVSIVKLDPHDPQSPTRTSIFLSVFNVHVNRAPVAGRIKDVAHRPGAFKAAFADEASVVNEQSVVTIESERIELVFKQIAGLIARRIVFTKRPGDWVVKGERVGLIKFGSRVDVIVPPEVELTVGTGDRVYGGSSVIGRIGT